VKEASNSSIVTPSADRWAGVVQADLSFTNPFEDQEK